MKTKTDWWFRFFGHQDYLDIYKDMTGPERTQRELNFCARVLDWSTGQSILDAPCGAGRHAFALAKQGFRVSGLDASLYLLRLAQQEEGGSPQRPNFVRALMQSMPYADSSFDCAVCLFSSFGYGETEKDNIGMMKEFARVLKPGGKIMVDVMNRHFIVPRLNRVYESVQNGLRVREERVIIDDGRRMHNQITVVDKTGEKRMYLYRPWLYDENEISAIAKQAGLSVQNVYGNFWGDDCTIKSERAMLVAQKPDN